MAVPFSSSHLFPPLRQLVILVVAAVLLSSSSSSSFVEAQNDDKSTVLGNGQRALFLGGRVVDILGRPVVDATVQLWQTEPRLLFGSTTVDGTEGSFVFRTVLPSMEEGVLWVKVFRQNVQVLSSGWFVSRDSPDDDPNALQWNSCLDEAENDAWYSTSTLVIDLFDMEASMPPLTPTPGLSKGGGDGGSSYPEAEIGTADNDLLQEDDGDGSGNGSDEGTGTDDGNDAKPKSIGKKAVIDWTTALTMPHQGVVIRQCGRALVEWSMPDSSVLAPTPPNATLQQVVDAVAWTSCDLSQAVVAPLADLKTVPSQNKYRATIASPSSTAGGNVFLVHASQCQERSVLLQFQRTYQRLAGCDWQSTPVRREWTMADDATWDDCQQSCNKRSKFCKAYVFDPNTHICRLFQKKNLKPAAGGGGGGDEGVLCGKLRTC